MKKILTIIFFAALICASAFSQNYKEYKLSNGIPVYAIKNTVNKIDSVSIVVKGGCNYYDREHSGIEAFLFNMMMQGSSRYSYEDIKALKYETQSSYSTSSIFEGSCLTLTSIDDYLGETLPVLLDGFTHPSFNQSEYNKMKTNYGEAVQSMLNDPVKLALHYSKMVIYQNHPYDVSPSVIPDSLENLTIPAMKNLHKTLMDSRRIYIVAVTTCEPEEYLSILEKELGSIKKGSAELIETAPDKIPPVNVKRRPVVLTHGAAKDTGFYFRAVEAPSVTSDEYMSYALAKKIYNNIMHNVLRVKYSMCYGAEAEDVGIVPNVAFELLFRCPSPDDLKNRMAEARNIMAQGKYILGTDKNGEYILSDLSKGIEGYRNALINSLYESQLTTSGIAMKKAASILYYGDVYSLENQYALIKNVTVQNVIDAFNKYFVTDNEFWFACVSPEREEEIEELLKN